MDKMTALNPVLAREISDFMAQGVFTDSHLSDLEFVENNEKLALANRNGKILAALDKPFTFGELRRAIWQVAYQINAGDETPFTLGDGAVEIVPRQRLARLGSGETLSLTDKEIAVLLYLAKKNPEKTVSKRDLLSSIWGYHHESETHTVETHIYRLRQKLSGFCGDEIIRTEEGGYAIRQND